jgi:hypothetical protein
MDVRCLAVLAVLVSASPATADSSVRATPTDLEFRIHCERCNLRAYGSGELAYYGVVKNRGAHPIRACSDKRSIVATSVRRDGRIAAPLYMDDGPFGFAPNGEDVTVAPRKTLEIRPSMLLRKPDDNNVGTYFYLFRDPGIYSVQFEYRCGALQLKAPPLRVTVIDYH